MKKTLKRLKTGIVAAALAICAAAPSLAQQPSMTLVNPTTQGHIINAGSGGTAIPTFTNCTVVGPASDTDGECTSSSTSASITFAQPWATAPYCILVDATSAATVPQLTYTTSTTAITVSTVTSGHNLFWHCGSRTGG